jgi:hypothetical protein
VLRNWGNVLEAQENWVEALQIYIGVLAIDLNYNEELISLNIKDLGKMLKVLEESKFETVWRNVTGEECSEEWLSVFRAANEAEEE